MAQFVKGLNKQRQHPPLTKNIDKFGLLQTLFVGSDHNFNRVRKGILIEYDQLDSEGYWTYARASIWPDDEEPRNRELFEHLMTKFGTEERKTIPCWMETNCTEEFVTRIVVGLD